MFRRIFIPTISDEYRQSQEDYHRAFSVILEEKRAYLTKLEDVLERAECAKLHNLEQQTQGEKSLISTICESIEECNTLSAHRKEVMENIANYEHILSCQTTLDMTGFYELQDWAKAIFDAYNGLATSLITLSLAGAAIVYATIFSAVRGNIGLMAFTFPLFSIGFIVPALIQTGLSWAADRSISNKRTPFASQLFWRIAIGVFMAIASLCVMAAITILNFTVFELRQDSEDLTDSIPRVAGIVAFTFSGLLVLLFVLSMALSAIAHGPKTLFLGVAHMNRQKKGWKLENFDHKGMRRKP